MSDGGRTARAFVLTAALFTAGPALLGTQPAGAAGANGLHPLRCTKLSTDIPLEPPQYAQQQGAGDATDEWWCDLPHATEVPTGYVQLHRTVAPLAFPYALYTTYYGARGAKDPTTIGSSSLPHIAVTDEVNGTPRRPGPLQYPAVPKGGKVVLAKGVSATLVTAKGTVSVQWRYPTKGVPKYLQGVAAVTVTGTNVSRRVVLAVARRVQPD